MDPEYVEEESELYSELDDQPELFGTEETIVPTDTESFDEELSEESDVLVHPRLGFGRRVSRQGELEDFESAGLTLHPRLGIGRQVVRDEEIGEEPESELEIVGADDRNLIRKTLAVPFRWICALDLYFPDPDNPAADELYRGTGTLIGPRHVLTAGHCLYDRIKGSAGTHALQQVRKVIVTPARNGAAKGALAKAPLGSTSAAAVRTSSGWRTSRDDQFDFGLITLKDALGEKWYRALGNRRLGFWGSKTWGVGTRIRPRTPTSLRNRGINISGYPADKCRDQPPTGSASEAQIQACATQDWASTQWHGFGRVTQAGPPAAPRLLIHTVDTKGGHSGSPLWLRWKRFRNLVAIHTGWHVKHVSNHGVRITPDVLKQVRTWM
jgi:V8-like Glu-specific endopeptidase